MTPAMGMLILEAALKWGPVLATEIAQLFSKPTHSLDDWMAIFGKIKTYDELDAESRARVGLPPVVVPDPPKP
jgi:hypothetical protein